MARGGRGGAGTASNAIFGTNGDDILDGRGLSYLLSGGKGDDTYYVDDAEDVIDEKNNGGKDHVFSLIDYVLGNQLENLTLMGPNARSGTGNDSDNVLTGNDQDNTLLGFGGDDTISGGGGSDVIDGGDGTDTAVFEGLSTDYTFRWVGSNLHVVSAALGTTDVLRNIEMLSFSNGLLPVSSIGGAPTDPSAPQAVNDAKLTSEDTPSVVAVLLNDLGTGIVVASATNGSKGLVTINPDGTVSYTPNANAFGSDIFTYTIRDSLGRESTATVTIQIADVNDAPVARADSYTTTAGSTYSSTTSVLANDTDVDGNPLAVIGAGADLNLQIAPGSSSYQSATSAGGTVTINANGTFTYTPAAGFTGTDSFAYAVGDGQGGQGTATVTLTVNATPPDPSVRPYYVDGVLPDYDSWRLNYPDAYGTPATVTYTFLTSAPSYYGASHTVSTSFAPMTEQQEQAVRDILAKIESFSNLTFVETSADSAEMIFGLADLQGVPAMAGPAQQDGVGNTGSDVWMDVNFAGTTLVPGTLQYSTLLHEIGHALGLEHPGLPEAEATKQYTVMAGSSHPTMIALPVGYQLYDVAALQYLYGTNTSFATGNDVYSFSAFNGVIKTVWDGGGHDTFDMSGATYGVKIDLNGGAFSTVTPSGSNNVAIAFGAVIEDAKGGAYNDVLIGNTADNRLTGGGGADVFGFGSDWGNDTITDFQRGVDLLDFSGAGLAFADLSVTTSGGNTLVSNGSDSVLLLGVSSIDASDLLAV